MKKVGIITFHCAKNYGALLQGYALQQTIENLGNQCEIVDYKCKSMIKAYKPFQFYKNDPAKSVLKSAVMFRRRARRIKSFKSFYNNYLKLSAQSYDSSTIDSCRDKYDIFVTGSDQVWGIGSKSANPDSTFYLDFADDKQKYSYAASFGKSDIPDFKVPVISKLLDGFQAYSVREPSGVGIVKKTVGKEAMVHIDPTFLLPAAEWKKIAVKKVNTPYILVFNVKPVKSLWSCAVKLSKEKGVPIIYINDNPHKKAENIEYVVAPSVEEFLGYIANAEYVVTNSFHGTALSVIMHKNLFVEYETATGRNNRAEDLLNMLEIKREVIGGNSTETVIDWNSVDEKIKEQQIRSQNYLKEITK